MSLGGTGAGNRITPSYFVKSMYGDNAGKDTDRSIKIKTIISALFVIISIPTCPIIYILTDFHTVICQLTAVSFITAFFAFYVTFFIAKAKRNIIVKISMYASFILIILNIVANAVYILWFFD